MMLLRSMMLAPRTKGRVLRRSTPPQRRAPRAVHLNAMTRVRERLSLPCMHKRGVTVSLLLSLVVTCHMFSRVKWPTTRLNMIHVCMHHAALLQIVRMLAGFRADTARRRDSQCYATQHAYGVHEAVADYHTSHLECPLKPYGGAFSFSQSSSGTL